MAVQLLETLEQSITAYTGLSSATFITLLALSIAGYYAVSGFFSGDNHPPPRSRSYEEDMQPLPPPVQLGEVSEEELKGYDGNDPKKPLLMAIKGQIYDVSQSRWMFYGPGGPYALFAGKDASRALAKMSFEEKDLNGDLTGLGVFELEALQDWEYKFMSKYVKVGTIKKPEPTPEPSTNDQPAEPSATEPAEPSAAKPAEPSLMEPAESTAAEPADHVPSEVAVGETKDETTSEANKHE
ncbi:putative cytochrome b5-like heme/steroid binding domain-containing protein [Helianthus annuus]|nr:putative cytochrome b5-like heme/steroid binding domain-containing protein [Helianthus annuus]